MRSEDSLNTRSSSCRGHENTGISFAVTTGDRLRLEAIVGDCNAKQKHVKRAKVILATADGCGTVIGAGFPALDRFLVSNCLGLSKLNMACSDRQRTHHSRDKEDGATT
jgi:hypothetical protein